MVLFNLHLSRFRISCMNKYGISPFSYSSSEIRTERSGTASIRSETNKMFIPSVSLLLYVYSLCIVIVWYVSDVFAIFAIFICATGLKVPFQQQILFRPITLICSIFSFCSIDEEKRSRLLQQQKSATRIASSVQSRLTPATSDDYSIGEEVKLKKADPAETFRFEGEIAR